MFLRTIVASLALFCLGLAGHSTGNSFQSPDSTTNGSANGTLVIVGGGPVGNDVYEAFARYAGGFDTKLLVIPTANQPDRIDTVRVRERWINRGFTNTRVLHNTDPQIADSDSIANLIGRAHAIWFEGGRQWRLVDAYGETKAEKAFHDLLARGGVIGGTSAGATIQGSFLVRGDVSGNTIMITANMKHQRGFGFLKNSAIDQHIDARNRWTDLREVIEKHPHLLGIGISESTAIVVQGDRFRVIGPGKVAITTTESLHDEESPYLTLVEGDWYDIGTRKVLKK
jgi:cyanophycinase